MKHQVFSGSGVAMVTPFCLDLSIDYPAFKNNIIRQIYNGSEAIIVGATTGEGSTLSLFEKKELFAFAVKICDGKVPVVASIALNDTKKAALLAKTAQAAGVDALLVTTPFYNKCSQSGIVSHFGAVASACDLPIIMYDIPARSGMQIDLATYEKLAQIEQIVGVKDCCENLDKITRIYQYYGHKISIYSGVDSLNLPIYACGGSGCISVTANLLPAAIQKVYKLFDEGKTKQALRMHCYLQKLNTVLFCQVNPIPIKYAMSKLGLCLPVYRLPLSPPDVDSASQIENALKAYGVIK